MATVTQQPAPGSYTTSTVLIEAQALQDMLNRLKYDFERRYGVKLSVTQDLYAMDEGYMSQDGASLSGRLNVEVKL